MGWLLPAAAAPEISPGVMMALAARKTVTGAAGGLAVGSHDVDRRSPFCSYRKGVVRFWLKHQCMHDCMTHGGVRLDQRRPLNGRMSQPLAGEIARYVVKIALAFSSILRRLTACLGADSPASQPATHGDTPSVSAICQRINGVPRMSVLQPLYLGTMLGMLKS